MRNKTFWENNEMSAIEKLVFLCINDWGNEPMTAMKIVEHTGLDRKTVFKAIRGLEEKGFLKRQRANRANLFEVAL